ncbi:MAG: hypothetical protein J2P15_20875, partial [Micromonosporaceae bacterium]|nr:hypothetical protein [Micromonosporaceae bacterium]
VVPRVLGPRLGGAVQQVIRAVKAGEWTLADGVVTAGGQPLREGEYELRLVAADAEHSAPLRAPGGHAQSETPAGEGVVVLDTAVTPELAAEGLARDVIRVLQQARREAGLDVSDRITAVVEAPEEVAAAVAAHRDFIAGETLSRSVEAGPAGEAVEAGPAGEAGYLGEAGDGIPVRVAVTRVP